MNQFEILAGLPPYGPMPLPFPPGNSRAHTEGLVVRFRPNDADAWVGNFQRGETWLDIVLAHPDKRQILVIAGGTGYVIDPEAREQTRQGKADEMLSSEQITSAEHRLDLGILLLSDGFRFGALKAGGGSWTSDNVNWEGDMRNVAIRGARLSAEVPSLDRKRWLSVELDLNTGDCVGGGPRGLPSWAAMRPSNS